MTTINYAPRNWKGADSALNAPETVRLEVAVQTALTAVDGSIIVVQAALTAVDRRTIVVPLAANGTARVWLARSTARTLATVSVRRQGALASAGTITLAVQDGDGTTLLSTATIDAKALTAAFVAQTLTATTADRALVAGEPIQVVLVSNDADATGGPAIVEVSYVAE